MSSGRCGLSFFAEAENAPTATWPRKRRLVSCLRLVLCRCYAERGKMLQADTFDSYDVLQGAFMETRDLLATFRFDNDETRNRI